MKGLILGVFSAVVLLGSVGADARSSAGEDSARCMVTVDARVNRIMPNDEVDKEFIETLRAGYGIDAAKAIDTILNQMEGALKEGSGVKLRGFSIFELRQRKAGVGEGQGNGNDAKKKKSASKSSGGDVSNIDCPERAVTLVWNFLGTDEDDDAFLDAFLPVLQSITVGVIVIPTL